MGQDNKISMPTGQGGLTRFNTESPSKIKLSPGVTFVLCVVVMVVVILLHYFGDFIFGQ